MQAEVTGLVTDADGRVAGVRGHSPDGAFEIRADCTIGCDGRHSTVRAAAGLAVEDVGAPIDVLWFRVGRDPGNEDAALARVAPGHSSSPSTAATTGNAPSSFPRAAPRRCAPADRGLPRAGGATAPLLGAHIGDVRSWTTSSC
jgi:2-polyprenyl-6-methoxyphenol hydroxylase-like FAD-dependent oxidoreductase